MKDVMRILEDGFSLDALVARISLSGLLATIAVALFCALSIYFAYRYFYPGIIYSANYNLLLVLVTLITAMIIMTISSNIVLSLGMGGALSIVRFRTAVKDPLDVGFLFLGISAGITAGAGLFLIAVCGTLLILAIFIAISQIKSSKNAYLLILAYENEIDDKITQIANRQRVKLKNKTISAKTTEATYQVMIKKNNADILKAFAGIEELKNSILLEFPGEHTI